MAYSRGDIGCVGETLWHYLVPFFIKRAGAGEYSKWNIFCFWAGVVEWNRKENQILNFKFNLLLPFFKKRGVCRGFTRKIARFGFKMGGLTSLV